MTVEQNSRIETTISKIKLKGESISPYADAMLKRADSSGLPST